MTPTVLAVHRSPTHSFSKEPALSIRLIAGLGVEGDAHAGETVKHRSRVARDPTQPNLRQVHLIHAELLDELNAAGFTVKPGDMGENITTRGLDLLALPTGTRLTTGDALIQLTGLRNPCVQLDRFQQGADAGDARPRRRRQPHPQGRRDGRRAGRRGCAAERPDPGADSGRRATGIGAGLACGASFT